MNTMNYPFRLLFVKKGDTVYYRVVYQDETFHSLVIPNLITVMSSACPAAHVGDIFVRGYMDHTDHRVVDSHINYTDGLDEINQSIKEHYEEVPF